MEKKFFIRKVNWLVGAILFVAALLIQTTAGAVEFTVTADPRDKTDKFENVLSAIVSGSGIGNFHVSCGDIDPPSNIRSVIDSIFGSSAIWIPVIGNHEAETVEDMNWLRNEYANANGSLDRQALSYWIGVQGPTSAEETCYSWNWDNAHFIVLNEYYNGADDNSHDGDIWFVDDAAYDPVTNPDLYHWLKADLEANDKPFVFVFGHEPAYPQNRHLLDSLNLYEDNRNRFWQLLNDHNVSAYICAHTHFYSTWQEPGYSWSGNPSEATWQIDVGHAGNKSALTPGGTDYDHYTFLKVVVSDTQVTYNVYRAEHSDWSFTLSYTWSQPLPPEPPDLLLSSTDISFNPPDPQNPGTNVDITATIHNDGGTNAICDVFVWYDNGGVFVPINNVTGISVAAGETTDVTTTWYTTELATTTYSIYVTINNSDPAETITDNNEAHSDYALPVELMAFSTRKQANGNVLIRWQTASETMNAGWNILRRPAKSKNDWQKVNTPLIAGAGTAPFGKTYEFIDHTTRRLITYYYTLEWISTNGKVERSDEVLLGDRFGNFIEAQTEETELDGDAISINKSDDGVDANWRTAYNSADYVIITPRALVPAVRELAEFRRHQGRQVKIVPIEDIYALYPEFSGEKAIRHFLLFAYNHWAPPKLRYVLLAGDAVMTSNDNQAIYKGILPTFVRKMPGLGFIPTDYPYACLTGADSVPELVVGRLPARSPVVLKSMVKKIIRHELSPPNRKVVFANGDYVVPGDEYAETSSEALIRDFCEDVFDVTRIYTMPVAASLQPYQGGADDLAAVFEDGCGWLEFRGHGAASLWAGLLEARSAKIIANSQLPIVTSVSCFTGFFTDPNNRMCMAEALLKNPVGGAVAYLGNTGHGMVFAGHDFSVALWEELNDGNITIGDAVFNAKKSLAEKRGDRGFLHSINLFGDPATKVKIRPSR